MELMVTELFSLIVMASLLFSRRALQAKLPTPVEKHMKWVVYTYVLYLVLALLSHVHILGFITYTPGLARTLIILHSISVPVFTLVWMTAFERELLSAKYASLSATVQTGFLVIYITASLLDILLGSRLFIFSGSLLVTGGYGLPIMFRLSLFYTVFALAVILAHWRVVDSSSRLIMLLSTLFLMLSLIMFQIFRQPYMFALSCTFMLLLRYLSWQRKELMLDTLTRIPNNQAFQEDLNRKVNTNTPYSILMVDMENFRLINDRYGYGIGDEILRRFAAFCSTSFTEAKTYRIVGNRFALIFPLQAHYQLVRIVKALVTETARGWMVHDQMIRSHLNIAIVELPLQANTSEEVMESLDFTLLAIKEKRRQSVIIFNQKLMHVRKRKLDVLSAIRAAILDESKILVYYQPIVALKENRIIGAEALMRLQDDRLGIISPAEFIPGAEEAGLISKLTEIIVRKACVFLETNPLAAARLSHLSLNISADDLTTVEAARKLAEIFEQTPIDKTIIRLEVTESVLLSSPKAVSVSWSLLSDLGLRFMLDDFGTGYANLETLVQLPFEIVKIDRSVVSNGQNNFELLALISGMLARLGKQIIAEGVETAQQLEQVRALGIPYVQGYYFSKPVPEEQFLHMITETNK
jgi:diguanylate cyclase (GGDEF)-like protein